METPENNPNNLKLEPTEEERMRHLEAAAEAAGKAGVYDPAEIEEGEKQG